jgi:hypothetical protein
MATTPRFGLHYQTLTDSPDGAGLGGLLAADVDAWLARAYVVADAAARTGLSGIGTGFIVFQQDDATLWAWSGSAWSSVTGSGGGGGEGGSSALAYTDGQYRAAANQTLSNGTDTILAFATTETASAVVTRATSGVGHKFTLSQTGLYSISATVRFAAGSSGSRFIELRNAAQNARYVSSGEQGGPAASTRTFSLTRGFSAGQDFVVVATQSSGGNLATQYQGTSITDGFVRLNITKIG